ncbi:unnamed protein product [Ambrosiozyma monospora]|uniref:Unnamed protein product n=1 Tax=Ambrosiozyma monospora TaxID=43982 RepID=A0ACB5TZW3_AMBMO|nr:unnamed protein product [Ambrosiozyma monospora]
MDRKALLEAKRAKLEELRRQRLEKQIRLSTDHQPKYSTGDINNIVSDLLQPESFTASSQGLAPVTETTSTDDSNDVSSQHLSSQQHPETHVESEVEVKTESIQQRNPSDAPVRHIDVYDKAVETDFNSTYDDLEEYQNYDPKKLEQKIEHKLRAKLEAEIREKLTKQFEQKLEREKQLDSQLNSVIDPLIPSATPQLASTHNSVGSAPNLSLQQLTPEEQNPDANSKYAKEISSDDSGAFMDKNASQLIRSLHVLENEDTVGRCITSIDLSSFYPELVLVSYGSLNKKFESNSGPNANTSSFNSGAGLKSFV